MRLLDRHILRELMGPFFFGVCAFTSLMFAGKELFQIMELITENHASLLVALKLVVLFLPSLIVMTLPMSMLLAALLGFGRLSSDSEVVALFASGVSIYRIAVPVVLMAVVVTCGNYAFNEIVAPKASYQHEKIIEELTKEAGVINKPVLDQDVVNGVTHSIYYVRGGFNAADGTARDVSVIEFNKNKPWVFVYGKEAVWTGGDHPDQWSFKDGYYRFLDPNDSVTVPFRTTNVMIGKTPSQIELFQRKPDEMTFAQLRSYVQIMEHEGQNPMDLRVRLYQKISLPLASLVFALIGTPLGLRPHRSSSAMGLGLSMVIIFAYWVLTHYMSILGEQGTLSPAAASCIPTLAGAFGGIALVVRAAK